MPQLIPVDHDPFDMAGMLARGGSDWQRGVDAATQLRQPAMPPPQDDRAAGLLMAMGSAGPVMADKLKHSLDFFSVPGRIMQGTQPETPGVLTEEDQFRANHLANQPYEWGPQTAFNEVFWPRTGTNVGGAGFSTGSGAIVPPPKQGIRAYHGSPHDFERFDISKIGTGEGAQSYGHGLYFAENPAVAESYKNRFIDNGLSPLNPRNLWTPARVPDPAVKGRMYEVNINAKPEQFLDWDKRLGEQSEYVRQRMAPMVSEYDPRGTAVGQYLYRHQGHTPVDTSRGYGILREADEARASGVLREAGIPGIKYLDQGSRFPPSKLEQMKAGYTGIEPQRTSNYVLFDDKLVDILRKYGVAGLSMLPPAVAAHVQSRLIPVDHDPFAQ